MFNIFVYVFIIQKVKILSKYSMNIYDGRKKIIHSLNKRKICVRDKKNLCAVYIYVARIYCLLPE